ncbi:MAG: sulfite exporter TauE/SafE family protein [Eubacteriales bacterium]|nr:sulfite exporter TauE/SafE family protein [Eubacteriales bacterium]
MSIRTIHLNIDGMSCANCENTIQQKLRAMPGVQKVNVSFGKGTADVTFDGDVSSRKALEAAIVRLGYSVIGEQQSPGAKNLRAAGFLLVIAALFVTLQVTGALNYLVPSQLAQAGMGYGMLFVIGLITSVHCVAMCGGINLSQCVTAGNAGSSKTAALKPSFLYNLGRVISYTVVGFIVGALGSAITFSPATQGVLKLIAGLFMVVMGVNMLGIFPWLRKLNPRMPKFISDKVNAEKWKSNSPLVVGLLNGLMPCGPLQAMQIYALSTGNPFAGALSMLLFSLGTVPLMFGLGALSTVLSRKFTRRMLTAGAVMVAVLGLSMLSQGWVLTGVTLPKATAQSETSVTVTATSAAAEPDTAKAGDVQIITSTLASSRYPDITVQVGVPVRWTINAPLGSINGCNNRMYIPAYNIEHTFTQGDNVIEFTPTETGTFPYSCWMGMIQAKITVVEAGTATPAAEDNTAQDSASIFNGANTAATPTPAGYEIPTDAVAVAQMTTDENGNPLQRVEIALTDTGFSPAVVVVQSGTDVEWSIRNDRTDASALWVPDYYAQLTLATGKNLFYLTPVGDFAFSDAASVFFGYVKVVDDVTKADLAAIRSEVAQYQTLRYPASYFTNSAGGSCCQ